MSSVSSGRRRLRRILAACAVIPMLTVLLTGCDETKPKQRNKAVGLVNGARTARGLPKVRQAADLNAKAGRWAAKLRDECRLRHSNLRDGVTLNWRELGENVGWDTSIRDVHRTFMNSSIHRGNILNRRFDRVGVGLAWGSCNGHRVVYEVQVFADVA